MRLAKCSKGVTRWSLEFEREGADEGPWIGHHGSSQESAERSQLRVLDSPYVLLTIPRSVRLGKGEEHVRYSSLSTARKSC